MSIHFVAVHSSTAKITKKSLKTDILGIQGGSRSHRCPTVGLRPFKYHTRIKSAFKRSPHARMQARRRGYYILPDRFIDKRLLEMFPCTLRSGATSAGWRHESGCGTHASAASLKSDTHVKSIALGSELLASHKTGMMQSGIAWSDALGGQAQ